MIVKIREVAAEMGYRVNPTARALRAGASRLIGMVVPVIGIPFFARLVDAIEEELNTAGYELLLADSHGFVEDEFNRLQVLRDRGVDGLVLIPSDRNASVPGIKSVAGDVKIVQVDRAVAPPLADFVGVDNQVGISLLFEHLMQQGVRTIAYAGADDASSNGVERTEQVRLLAAANKVKITGEFRSEFSVAAGKAAADQIVDGAGLPDAIIAASDQIAVGVIAGLRERGVEVPRDLLVTGFDGGELAEIYWPSVTTVVQPVRAIAAETVAALLRRIKQPDAAFQRTLIAPTLQVGASTGK